MLSIEQCTLKVASGLVCGCPTFVNPNNEGAIDELAKISDVYEANACRPNVLCGACADTTRAFCSGTGRCEDKVGASCKVDGVVYRDGATLKDPFSCNSCMCADGEVTSCTERGCPEPCPEGTAAGSSCVECGPADECLVREHGCFPVCMDTCADGRPCIQGVCVPNICG
jgi:hypothetical protein